MDFNFSLPWNFVPGAGSECATAAPFVVEEPIVPTYQNGALIDDLDKAQAQRLEGDLKRTCDIAEKVKRDLAMLTHEPVQIVARHQQLTGESWIDDKSRPFMVPGERVEVHVPFEGEAELFYAQPNTWTSNPPRAFIEKGELVLRYDSPADAPRDVRPLIDRTLADIEQYLDWQRSLIDAHNNGLPVIAEQAIQQRRERLLAQSQRAAALGIPVKRREDAPKTYAIPTARKKAIPVLPPASAAPFTPEPVWAMEQYEHALKIMQDMTLVMERSPDAFKTMDEEALRQHFLVQLNGQFEGKATGETFNMSGKTDILLRADERNVFIAECKFWKGPKAFGEAIDQLLSYATWRDGKTAIVVPPLQRYSQVLTQAPGRMATSNVR